MDNRKTLQRRKVQLEAKLADPQVFRDAEAVRTIAIEYGKIEKELRAAEVRAGHAGAGERLVLEIRAGTGGEEAAIFAAELFRMYSNFAKQNGWQLNLIDAHPTSLGGYKEVIAEIAGTNAYQKLRHEAGVHRVQRIPNTEKTGRIHTSTASVAVLPQAEESDIEIKPHHIKVEFFRSSGPGGQNVNKVETAVRIHHLSTGLVVSSQESRSQQKNREQAMMLLRTKLLAAQRSAEAEQLARERRGQIGTAERAEKIRTYNFHQDRITDHRIGKSWHHIERILAGELDPIIAALQALG